MTTYENVPDWSNAKSNTASPWEFYKQYLDGVTRGRLEIIAPKVYHALRRNGDLQYVPKKYQK